MMFTKFTALFTLPLLAVATPWAAPTTTTSPPTTTTVTVTTTSTATPVSQCNTGAVQCCDSTTTSSSASGSALLALLGILVEGVNVPIGVTCSPISGVGIGGNSCTAAPLCCENNSFNGVVAIGCVPINVGA